MTRTETLTLSTDRRCAFGGVYGFVLRRSSAALVMPLVAFVRYAGDAFSERTVIVHEGVPILGTRLMERVELALVSGGQGNVDATVADEPGDVLRRLERLRSRVVYDQTSGANAALDTGILDVGDCSALLVILKASAAIVAANFSHSAVLEDGTIVPVQAGPLTAGATEAASSWGLGAALNNGGLRPISLALPRRVSLNAAALGAAVTGRLVVIGEMW